MKHFAKCAAAAAVLLVAGSASAADLVYSPHNASGMVGVLSFGSDWVNSLDIIRAVVTSYAPGSAGPVKDTDGFFTRIDAAAPLTSLVYDDVTGATTSLGFSGGFTLTLPPLKSVSSGGSLTVTDMSIDLPSRTVYANLIGGHGLGTLSHVALWQAATLSGGCQMPWFTCSAAPVWDCMSPVQYVPAVTLSGLDMTVEGRAAFNQGLGLLTLGKSGLDSRPTSVP